MMLALERNEFLMRFSSPELTKVAFVEMEGFNNLRKDSNSQDVCYSCILNLYRASLCLDRDVIVEVNRLIYQFIWKRERQKK